ncbi:MAG: carbohydrate binding family 9 domain-containing protein, partial [Acidobacteria bacterium]|nr:carbohydrate binding family 9 domain-containing protein [Acidobacteriota bacterium]
MRCRFGLPTVLLVASLQPVETAAQPTPSTTAVSAEQPVTSVPSAALIEPSSAFDIRTINPETFQAIAFRIPEGQQPVVDGRLDDEVWSQAPVQGNFVQREPSFGQPATERTEFRVLYDDRRIYFGVWMWDSDASGILGNEMKRDSGLRRGDQIKIAIDTFHDHRNAFYFSTNPLGALKDANTVENGRTINYDWNVVYQNRTSIDERGWYVEMAVPLSQLRFASAISEATWGLNLCR